MTATATASTKSHHPLVALYDHLISFAEKWRSPFLLFIRLYIGYQCIISGWAHIHNLQSTTKFFASMHIPAPELSVILSATTELFGGALLLVGFGSRLIAFILTINFAVALLAYELSQFSFSYKLLGSQIWKDQTPILNDTAFPFLATTIVILLFGPGWLSIDGLIRVGRGKKK
jgi:putative oxidoreductase